MQWSQLKKRVEETFADSVKGRVEVWSTRYRRAVHQYGESWITIDKKKIATMGTLRFEAAFWRTARQLKEKQQSTYHAADKEAWLLLQNAGIFARRDLHKSLFEYLNLSIDAALTWENPIIRAFAMLDKRCGKRRLAGFKPGDEHSLVCAFYEFRCHAEGLDPEQPSPTPTPMRSTTELIELALLEEERDYDVSQDYPAMQMLHARGNREVLDAGIALCRSPSPAERRLGARILGELGTPERTFPDECCDALVDLAQNDPDSGVVSRAIFALGHLGNRRCEAQLLPLHKSADSKVRHAVAFALCGSSSPAAIEVLIRLMQDPYVEARDWATTAIGQTVSVDGPEIREALLQRATDLDELTRAEAIHGLARRKDKRAITLLIDELQSKNEHSYVFVDAALTFLELDDSQSLSTVELIELLKSRQTPYI